MPFARNYVLTSHLAARLKLAEPCQTYMAVGQHQWYHVGVGAPLILVYFSGDWDVHWGYGVLTHAVSPRHWTSMRGNAPSPSATRKSIGGRAKC